MNQVLLPVAPTVSWKKRLLRLVAGLFMFEAVSGLVIWLLPFNLTTQFMVLVHTLLGVVFVIPFAITQVQHFPGGWAKGGRFQKWLGVTGCAVVSVAVISGVILTYQGSLSTRISEVWHYVHLVSSIACVPLVVVHITPLARKLTEAWTTVSVASQGRPLAREVWLVPLACVVVTVVAVALYDPVDYSSYSLPAGYMLAYGENPFAPSLARTESTPVFGGET